MALLDDKKIAYGYKEAAEAVSMSVDFIRAEKRAGRLGFTQVGSRILIPRAELERWFSSFTTGPLGA